MLVVEFAKVRPRLLSCVVLKGDLLKCSQDLAFLQSVESSLDF